MAVVNSASVSIVSNYNVSRKTREGVGWKELAENVPNKSAILKNRPKSVPFVKEEKGVKA